MSALCELRMSVSLEWLENVYIYSHMPSVFQTLCHLTDRFYKNSQIVKYQIMKHIKLKRNSNVTGISKYMLKLQQMFSWCRSRLHVLGMHFSHRRVCVCVCVWGGGGACM